LGVITSNVRALIKETGYPGMKVIMFGMEGPADHEYLPHNELRRDSLRITFINKKVFSGQRGLSSSSMKLQN
jgi:hypothetical protein